MKITIIKKRTKEGERYYAYRSGILSRLGVYCFLNYINLTGARSEEDCIANARYELEAGPKPNKTFVSEVEI